jgi:putative hydrolase of the HAD superfamily
MYSYIFDIGSVLVNYDDEKVVDLLTRNFKCELEAVQRLFTLEKLYQPETGRVSGRAFFDGSVKPVIPDLTYEKWLDIFTEHFALNETAMELLLELKQKGRKVYILSNLAEFHRVAIERKIPGFFNHCCRNFLSYELGYHKPEREIFRKVCEEIGEMPWNCVFFDDVEKNIKGAEQVGIVAIQYSNERIDEIRKKVHLLEEEAREKREAR